MVFLWLVTGVALATAVLAWREARKTARRLEQLSQMYWALRYQHSELRSQLQRMQPEAAAREAEPRQAAGSESPGDQGTGVFVPLSSLRRRP